MILWHLADQDGMDILDDVDAPGDIKRVIEWHNSMDNMNSAIVLDRHKGINITQSELKYITCDYKTSLMCLYHPINRLYDMGEGINIYASVVTGLCKRIPMELINEILKYVG
jgi:hypothetical protein